MAKVVAGLFFNAPAGPFLRARPTFFRRTQWAEWPLGLEAGLIGVLAWSLRGGPCSRYGIRRSCRSKTADSKALGFPGCEARVEPSSEPERVTKWGASGFLYVLVVGHTTARPPVTQTSHNVQ